MSKPYSHHHKLTYTHSQADGLRMQASAIGVEYMQVLCAMCY